MFRYRYNIDRIDVIYPYVTDWSIYTIQNSSQQLSEWDRNSIELFVPLHFNNYTSPTKTLSHVNLYVIKF